jgi:hypothetical protein
MPDPRRFMSDAEIEIVPKVVYCSTCRQRHAPIRGGGRCSYEQKPKAPEPTWSESDPGEDWPAQHRPEGPELDKYRDE